MFDWCLGLVFYWVIFYLVSFFVGVGFAFWFCFLLICTKACGFLMFSCHCLCEFLHRPQRPSG